MLNPGGPRRDAWVAYAGPVSPEAVIRRVGYAACGRCADLSLAVTLAEERALANLQLVFPSPSKAKARISLRVFQRPSPRDPGAAATCAISQICGNIAVKSTTLSKPGALQPFQMLSAQDTLPCLAHCQPYYDKSIVAAGVPSTGADDNGGFSSAAWVASTGSASFSLTCWATSLGVGSKISARLYLLSCS